MRVAPLLVLDNERIPSSEAARKAAPPQGLLVVDSVDGRPQRQGDTPLLTGDPAQLFEAGGPVRVTGHVLGVPSERFTEATVAGVVDAAQASPGMAAASWKLGVSAGEQRRAFSRAARALRSSIRRTRPWSSRTSGDGGRHAGGRSRSA